MSSRSGSRWIGLLLLTIALLAGARDAAALDPRRPIRDYMIDFWQEDSGLPQKSVSTIQQTRDGYLWLGTRGGLARFDGVRFTVYDDRHLDQLQESEVVDIAEAHDGSLWVGTYGGGVTHMRDGVFTTYNSQHGLPSGFITAVAPMADGTVWIGTQGGIVLLKDGRVVSTYGAKEGFPPHVRTMFVDAEGVLWLGANAGLVMVRDGKARRCYKKPAEPASSIGQIAADGEGGLWLASREGLARYKDGETTLVWKTEQPVVGVCRDLHGTVWFATGGQVMRYQNGAVETFSTTVSGAGDDHTLHTFPMRSINTIFADREGSIWVGTGKYGLARFRDAVFSVLTPGDRPDEELEVSAVYGDRQGAVWMSLTGAGVARFDNGAFQKVAVDAVDVDTFYEDQAGTLWAVAREKVFRYQPGPNGAVGRFIPVSVPGLHTIINARVDRQGRTWWGGRDRGLYLYQEGQLSFFGKAAGLPGIQVRALAEDRQGGLWIGTKDGGLARLQDGRFTTYSTGDGLPSVSVSALHVDSDDTVWVATRRGFARLRGGKLWTYTAQHGLPANFFYQIVEDDLGYLWLTHGRGIVRVARQELNDVADGKTASVTCRMFGTESGMKSTAMIVPRQPAAHKARDGRIWFATGNGAAVVDPSSLVANRVIPPVWVEELKVDGRSSLPQMDAVFPPGGGDLEIRYTALSFVAPRAVRFKYKLEGFDTDWIDADTRRVAYYTKLPPAGYRFRVIGCNNDGVWNDTGHTISFRLEPHWYQTRWFRVALALLCGAAVLGTYRWRVRAHYRREKELSQRVDEALGHIKMLKGMLPICASCKKIRDDSGYWNQMETYIAKHSEVDFSHGICPECIGKLYPEYARSVSRKSDQ